MMCARRMPASNNFWSNIGARSFGPCRMWRMVWWDSYEPRNSRRSLQRVSRHTNMLLILPSSNMLKD